MSQKVDFLIIGAGIVGLTCALALHRAKFSVVVLERSHPNQSHLKDLSTYDNRVFAINPTVKQILSNLGLAEKIETLRTSSYHKMEVYDAAMDAHIAFDKDEVGVDRLGEILEHKVLQSVLLEEVMARGIPCQFAANIAEVEPKTKTLILESGERFSASHWIGADGARSWLRETMHIETDITPYDHHAVVATIQSEKPLYKTAYQWFHPTGPVALLPLQGSHDLSLVWSTQPERAKALLEMDELSFNQALTQMTESRLGVLQVQSKRFSYPLSKQHAKSYWKDHSILVGDAAHVIHPLAGLGLNLGLLDAATLRDAFVGWRAGGCVKLERWLNWYQRQRRAHNTLVMRSMDMFYHGFSSQRLGFMTLRNIGLGRLNKTLFLKKYFIDFALGKIGYTVPDLGKINHDFKKTTQGAQNALLS